MDVLVLVYVDVTVFVRVDVGTFGVCVYEGVFVGDTLGRSSRMLSTCRSTAPLALLAHCRAMQRFCVKTSGPPYRWVRSVAKSTVIFCHEAVAVKAFPKGLPTEVCCVIWNQ